MVANADASSGFILGTNSCALTDRVKRFSRMRYVICRSRNVYAARERRRCLPATFPSGAWGLRPGDTFLILDPCPSLRRPQAAVMLSEPVSNRVELRGLIPDACIAPTEGL